MLLFLFKYFCDVTEFSDRNAIDIFTGRFVVNGVQPQASGENSKVKVKVRVNIHGVFNVSSASMVEKIAPVSSPIATVLLVWLFWFFLRHRVLPKLNGPKHHH